MFIFLVIKLIFELDLDLLSILICSCFSGVKILLIFLFTIN